MAGSDAVCLPTTSLRTSVELPFYGLLRSTTNKIQLEEEGKKRIKKKKTAYLHWCDCRMTPRLPHSTAGYRLVYRWTPSLTVLRSSVSSGRQRALFHSIQPPTLPRLANGTGPHYWTLTAPRLLRGPNTVGTPAGLQRPSSACYKHATGPALTVFSNMPSFLVRHSTPPCRRAHPSYRLLREQLAATVPHLTFLPTAYLRRITCARHSHTCPPPSTLPPAEHR